MTKENKNYYDINCDDISLINLYTKEKVSKEDVYVFSFVLANNDIATDFECITVESLYKLKELFLGKTGFFDGVQNSKARIFKCEVNQVENKKTKTGEDFFELKATAFVYKSDKTVIELLESCKIEQVSVAFAIQNRVCSICGETHCDFCHKRGKKYKNKLCYVKLKNPTDAYEFNVIFDRSVDR